MGSNYPFTETCPPPNTTPLFRMTVGAVDEGGAQGGRMSIYPWKQAQTCNIVNMYLSVQASLSTQVIQTTQNSQSNIIKVNANCDPTITSCKKFTAKHDKIVQTNLIDMDAVQRSFVSDPVQQLLNSALIILSSSVTKHMKTMPHLPSADDCKLKGPSSCSVSNVINSFMRVGISLNTHIEQDCLSTQSNYLEINVEDYGKTALNHDVIKQTNKANIKCTQDAVVGNAICQNISDSLSKISVGPIQRGNRSSDALMAFIIVIVIFFICAFIGIFLLWAMMIYGGYTFLFLSLFFFIFFWAYRPVRGAWYGYSPGIQKSDGAKYYTELSEKYYNDPEVAKLDCMNNPTCAAMDFVIDTDKITTEYPQAGNATFYSGDVDNYNKCKDITDMGNDEASNLIGIRNPWFRNAELSGNSPDDEIEGDVLLDVTSGNLWYRLPMNSFYGQQTTWVTPKQINKNNQNNVLNGNNFYNCYNGEITSLNYAKTGVKVYIYIDMKSTTLIDPSTSKKTSYPLPPEGGSYQIPIDRDANDLTKATYDIKSTVTQNDFFLVPYPIGCSDDPPNTEQYFYNQMFYLYMAKLDQSTGQWAPAWGPDKTGPPLNMINGYGIVPELQPFNSTFLKYKETNYWYLWLSIFFLVLGILLIGGKKYVDNKNHNTEIVYQYEPGELPEDMLKKEEK